MVDDGTNKDKDNSRQIQETVGRMSDDGEQCPVTTEKAKETRANSILTQPACVIEMCNTADNVKQSTNGANRISYEQSSRKVGRGY